MAISKKLQEKVVNLFEADLAVAQRNMDYEKKRLSEYLEMFHCQRVSSSDTDVYLPQFMTRVITQIGNFVSQYFASTDFVEPALKSDKPEDVAEASASKRLINAILNEQESYYYQKVVRLLMFTFICGYGVIKGGYRQKTHEEQIGVREDFQYVQDEMGNYMADDGQVLTDPMSQRPAKRVVEVPVYSTIIDEDMPFFDVYPNHKVYWDPSYVYSLQQKEWIIFEQNNVTLEELKADQDVCGYFGLDALEKDATDAEDNVDESMLNQSVLGPVEQHVSPRFTLFERYGLYPVIFDKEGKAKPGIGDDGKYKKDAELKECIITIARKIRNDSKSYLIRFQISPFTTRPVCRFLCYIDPIKDSGFGDGEVAREIQIATNDNYNLMNLRTKLATTPAFKAKRFAGLDEIIKIDPEKPILLENMDDLQELNIKDNIVGGLQHHSILTQTMDYALATSPIIMGGSPDRRETATSASIQNERANIRMGMKSMNLEFIGFAEFYHMILSLVDDFMLPETLERYLGDEATAFNPKRRDRFKPVSQALETEHSKQFKITMWEQILGRVAQIPNPKTPMVINYIIGQVLDIMGGNFKHFKKFMFEEDPFVLQAYAQATGTGWKNPGSVAQGPNPAPMQNQMGMAQSQQEQMTRR